MFESLPGADEHKVKPAVQQPIVEAVRERKAAREGAQRRKDQTTVWDGIGAAQVKGGIGFIDRFVTELGFDPTPGYRIPDDARKRWESMGLRPEQWELLGRATSDEHLSYLESIAFQNQMADDDLAQFGLGGQIALGLTDPVATGLDLATGGLGYAAKAGRLANAVRSGLQAAATSAVLSAATSQYDPEVTLQDGLQSAALSFAFGGALGARRGALYDGEVNPNTVKRLAFGDDSLSAARVKGTDVPDPTPGVTPIRPENAFEQEFTDKALTNAHITPHFANIRRDLAARMGSAKSPLVREAGRLLFRDGVGYTDRSIAVQESTSEFSKRHLAVMETEWRAGVNAAWGEYKSRTGAHWWNFSERAKFNEEIGRAVRGAADVSPEAKKAAGAVSQAMRSALKLAQDAKLDGFDNVAANANYLPRYWSGKGFKRLFGEMQLDETTVIDGLLKPAMRKAWEAAADAGDEIDDELLSSVAKAYLKRAQANFEGDGMDLLMRPLDADSVEEIGRMLSEAGVSPVRSQELLGKLEQKAYNAGKLDRAKRRIDIDETFTASLRNEAGEDVQVSVADLFDNDVDSVMTRYMREITGWSALSSKAGIKNRAQLDRFVAKLKSDARKSGDDVKDVERMIDIGLKSTFGRSTELDPASRGARYARFLRNWNFARVMNQVGFSLFAELGPTIAHAGVRNFWNSTTAAKDFLVRGADGQLSSKEARVMERLFAPGTDWLRNPPFLRTDEDALVPQTFNVKHGEKIDNAMNLATHVTSIASGMAPINTMLQRIAGRATMLRLLDMANAKKLSDAEVARLRTWGLDEKSQKLVFDYLRGKKRIEDIDPEKLPFETRERMSAFLFRVTRHQVLEGDASDSIELMHSTTGRIITQFRSFMVNSYTRHFLNSIHHYDDWRTYMMVVLSTSAAGMGWAARTYINTAGNPEQRKKQLTQANFYKNAVAQSSWSNVIPAVTDMVWADMMGNDPVFANNRSTGLENGVMGIPTIDLFNKVYGSTRMVGSAIKDDEEITEKQMRDFWKIWWFNNMTGVRNIADQALQQFPDRKDGTDRP
ncbi:hypothetical protein [uncultured Xanthomonas sp.]|uniref:hypothetical protein n=1 Tax=uncultured Xanthomonas sp. TaxID=152831 RepID=UPI0025FCF5E7|nr:hypothetical protein [uncultured Xanthomonas sp.]